MNSIPKTEITVSVRFSDFDLLERLRFMSDELDISWDDLVSMAVYRLLDDIYVIRRLWIQKKPCLKQSNIFPQGLYGVDGAEDSRL